MADQQSKGLESETDPKDAGEPMSCSTFLGKNEEKKPQEDVATTEAETTKQEEKTTLVEELHRSESNSSSSNDEEDGGDKKKKKKKKGLNEKVSCAEEEGDNLSTDTFPPAENDNEVANAEATTPKEKKGFMEKLKEKLPGQHKKAEDSASAECTANEHSPEGEAKEKKGILEKIKEKLPGCQKNEEKKDS